jgi:hypothetical protein
VERERDEAVGNMDREGRKLDRVRKEWALEKQTLEVRLYIPYNMNGSIPK